MLQGALRSVHAFCLAAVALVAGGCIQLEQKVMLNGDASLVVQYHYSVAEDSVALLAAGASVIQEWHGGSATTPAWFTEEEALRRHFGGTGARVQKCRTYSSGGRRHVELLVFADDGPAVLNAGLFGPLRCARLQDGSVRLWVDLPRVRPTATGMDDKALMALSQDLYLRLEMVVPGEIIRTTAADPGRVSAVWEFDSSKAPSFLRAPPRLECVFAARHLGWAERVPPAPL